MKHIILGIDPGSESSGIVILEEGQLIKGDNILNEDLFTMIDKYTLFDDNTNLHVIYEDIRPFTSRFNMDTINTIKVIGRLEYVLSSRMTTHTAVTRNHVKNMVFDKYPELAIPKIEAKIKSLLRRGKIKKMRKPSFIYVDDRIVEGAMKIYWGIEVKKGAKSPLGIRKHAWQALSVVTYYINQSH